MEPEVHIIEKYFQVVLGCLTMANVKCKGNKEIDLLAMNPKTIEKYHVESRVSMSFKLRLEATYTKNRTCHKDGLNYFHKEKFDHETVKNKIQEIFGKPNYHKVLVAWDTEDNLTVPKKANELYKIEVWLMTDLLKELLQKGQIKGSRDDILRTIEFMSSKHSTLPTLGLWV